MSYFLVNNIVFDNDFLTIKEDYFLLLLYKYRSTSTNIAKPKEGYLLEMLDCSARTLRRYSNKLEKHQLIERITKRGSDNQYKVLKTSGGGFTKLPSWFFGCAEGRVYEDMVIGHLKRLSGKGDNAWVSYKKLKDRVKCREDKIIEVINLKIAQNFLSKRVARSGNIYKCNL